MSSSAHLPDSQTCLQEQRLLYLESSLSSISSTLTDVRDLLKASIQADERIRKLQQEGQDQEKRLRSLETSHAAMRWVERVVWVLVAAGLAMLMNKG